MILVFIFLGIIILLACIFLILVLSTLKIKIENLRIGNYIEDKGKYTILIQIYFLDKLKILSMRLNNSKLRKIYSSKKFEDIDLNVIKQKISFNKDNLKVLKQLKIVIEKLNLKINIGTESAVLTSYLTAILASLIGIALPHLIKNREMKRSKYIINPIYNNTNIINLQLNSIISIKIVHIIYVIYHLEKKGRDKNERTSNRRSYAYSHEFN